MINDHQLRSLDSLPRQGQRVNWIQWHLAAKYPRPTWEVALWDAAPYAGFVVAVMVLLILGRTS